MVRGRASKSRYGIAGWEGLAESVWASVWQAVIVIYSHWQKVLRRPVESAPISGRKFGAPLTYTDCGLRGHFLADRLLLAGRARNRRPRLEADLGVAAISVLPEILEPIGRHRSAQGSLPL